jgi:hypothetical protein
MRRSLVALAALALAPAAHAAPPAVVAAAFPPWGAAPLRVTLTATGDAASYRWDFGDGTAAEGPSVAHVFPAGSWTATVTASSADGDTAQAQVLVRVEPRTIALAAPRAADYDTPVQLEGALRPPLARARVGIYRGRTYVGTVHTDRSGAFRLRVLVRAPGAYQARFGGMRSPDAPVAVRPRLEVSLPAAGSLGGPLALTARVVPAGAGSLAVRVSRDGGDVLDRAFPGLRASLALPTDRAGELRAFVTLVPGPGFAAAERRLSSVVVLPSLELGDRGVSVRELETRLAAQHYAQRSLDGVFGDDTAEAVLAFQKVHGLQRTGRVDPVLWRLLLRSQTPAPRVAAGDHIEVDKTRQVLLDVVGGKVARVVHISTGATGNTPVGTWRVYSRVAGWSWVLWYPLYFLRGFAVHGYPSVPSYPASHGCVRVPMWIAPELYSSHPTGTTVIVYS